MLLGWSPAANQEIVDIDKAIEKFSLKKVNKTAAVFSFQKLNWVNAEHIKKLSIENLTHRLQPLAEQRMWLKTDEDKKRLPLAAGLYQRRISTLEDFFDRALFYLRTR